MEKMMSCKNSYIGHALRTASGRNMLLAPIMLIVILALAASVVEPAAAITLNSNTWTPIGPAPSVNGNTDYTENASGRVVGLAAHPTDVNVIYLAAAGGGVWKTIDGGISWVPLTDNQSTLFMGAIALASSNPNVVYAGTGEANMGPSKARNSRNNIYYGRGILKSTDAGSTWNLLGGDEFNRRTVSKIVVDPTDAATVYVAVGVLATNGLPGNTGIWKSSDGGATWNITTANISTMAAFSDLVMDPSNSLTLYAAVGEPESNSSNGVYKTIDGGLNWSVAGNFPTGATDGQVGRISLAISQTAPRTLYASIARPGPPNTNFSSLYRIMKSTDAGNTWTALPINASLRICPSGNTTVNYLSTSGDYHNTLAVDPSNAYVVYAGGICLIRSIDGGNTWSAIARGKTDGPHRDHHALSFDAAGNLLDGNDGGIWRLDDPGPLIWTNLNGNLQITQFVGLALHPNDSDIAYGGTQDTGVMKFRGKLQWYRQLRGDGGAFAINNFSPNRVYAISKSSGCDGNFSKRSNNSGGTWGTRVTGIETICPDLDTNEMDTNETMPRTNFYPPLTLEPANANPNLDRLLLGTTKVYETVTGAEPNQYPPYNGSGWRAISTPGINGWTVDQNIDSLAVARSDPNTIYASAGGHIFVTFSNGSNWQQRDVPEFVDHFQAMLVDPTNNLIAYAVRDRFGGGHVFRTTNGGQIWENITGDLPDIPTYSIALDVRVMPNILYIGTDNGVYVSKNLGDTWSRFGSGLPNAQVVDLKLNPILNILAAGTHGRGVWEILLFHPEEAKRQADEGIPIKLIVIAGIVAVMTIILVRKFKKKSSGFD